MSPFHVDASLWSCVALSVCSAALNRRANLRRCAPVRHNTIASWSCCGGTFFDQTSLKFWRLATWVPRTASNSSNCSKGLLSAGAITIGVCYRITRSAFDNTDSGTVIPSSWAAFRLMISSKSFAYSIGISPALSPFRILSTSAADRSNIRGNFGP